LSCLLVKVQLILLFRLPFQIKSFLFHFSSKHLFIKKKLIHFHKTTTQPLFPLFLLSSFWTPASPLLFVFFLNSWLPSFIRSRFGVYHWTHGRNLTNSSIRNFVIVSSILPFFSTESILNLFYKSLYSCCMCFWYDLYLKSTRNTNKQYVCNIVHIYSLNKTNFYNSN